MIQFIIVGWHFENFPDFISSLLEIKNNNPEVVKVFWSCHKEPSQRIKDNFDYKVFPNLGKWWILITPVTILLSFGVSLLILKILTMFNN